MLKTNKPKGKKTLVLSKAKKLADVKHKINIPKAPKVGFEIENEVKEEEKPQTDDIKPAKKDSDAPPRKRVKTTNFNSK